MTLFSLFLLYLGIEIEETTKKFLFFCQNNKKMEKGHVMFMLELETRLSKNVSFKQKKNENLVSKKKPKTKKLFQRNSENF